MYCKNCGKKLSEDSLFCTSCGARVEAETYTDQTTWTYSDEYSEFNDYQPERRRLTPGARAVVLIIIVIVLVVAISNSNIQLGNQKVYTVTVKFDAATTSTIVQEYINGQRISISYENGLYGLLGGNENIAKVYIAAAKEMNTADIYKYNGKVY